MNKDRKERSRQRVPPIVTLVIVLGLIILVLVLLGPRPAKRFACVPGSNPTVPQAQTTIASTGYFIDSQVIVIGPADAIRAVIAAQPQLQLALIEDCDASFAGSPPRTAAVNASGLPFSREALNSLHVQLYRITGPLSVPNVVQAINAAGQSQQVFADPNYLTAGLSADCGSPYGIGGSPYGIGGSPYGIGGSQGGGLGPDAAQDLFWKQWAFEHIGVGPTLHDAYQVASVQYSGHAIRVGVFDTSPFNVVGAQSAGNTIETINWVTPTLSLTVVSTAPPVISSITSSTTITTDVSDHGLFVAGLIHGIAPQSDIRLYPVLDQRGCGDLYTLVSALFDFTNQVEIDQPVLHGAVINLSLGVLKPASPNTPDQPNAAAQVTSAINAQFDSLEADQLESLLTSVYIANSQGIVVVAAAGNDSWQGPAPLPPQLPAAYPFIIGVAGSNAERQRACFSNWGDVSAPSGDGAPQTCANNVQTCTGNCASALISLVDLRPDYPSGYAYWSGTSFATPLVSGLAALALEAGSHASAWLSPDQVAQAIHCGAATGDGVIYVPTTVIRCIR